jgi:hypothetical protein
MTNSQENDFPIVAKSLTRIRQTDGIESHRLEHDSTIVSSCNGKCHKDVTTPPPNHTCLPQQMHKLLTIFEGQGISSGGSELDMRAIEHRELRIHNAARVNKRDRATGPRTEQSKNSRHQLRTWEALAQKNAASDSIRNTNIGRGHGDIGQRLHHRGFPENMTTIKTQADCIMSQINSKQRLFKLKTAHMSKTLNQMEKASYTTAKCSKLSLRQNGTLPHTVFDCTTGESS